MAHRGEGALVAAEDEAIGSREDRPEAQELGIGGDRAPEVLEPLGADGPRVLISRMEIADGHEPR